MDVLWPHCSSCVLCLLVELAVEQRQKETALAQKAAAHAKRHDQDWPAEAVALYDDRAAAGERCLRVATWEWAWERFMEAESALRWAASSSSSSSGEEEEEEEEGYRRRKATAGVRALSRTLSALGQVGVEAR
jgi:hypothetical protein